MIWRAGVSTQWGGLPTDLGASPLTLQPTSGYGIDVARVDWAIATDIGRVRAINEDSVLGRPPLFLVADGMGGHAAGEVASGIATAVYAELVDAGRLTRDDIVDAVASANARILAAGDRGSRGMGTTLAGVALLESAGDPHWLAFNVGDSRVYRLSAGVLAQVSTDHSEVQELVELGMITAEQARVHPARNVITRSVGSDPAPLVDSWVLPVITGDRLLVCSDGLHGELDDEQITATVSVGDPRAAATRLIELALAAGGRDNVSVIVVDVLAGGRSASEADEDTTPPATLEPVAGKILIDRVPGVSRRA